MFNISKKKIWVAGHNGMVGSAIVRRLENEECKILKVNSKELNLERARMFALTNNMAGVQEELAKQGITAEKFAGMNRIAQEATAKAMGMSTRATDSRVSTIRLLKKSSA